MWALLHRMWSFWKEGCPYDAQCMHSHSPFFFERVGSKPSHWNMHWPFLFPCLPAFWPHLTHLTLLHFGRFLDRLLGGEDGKRTNRQLKDAEFGNKGIDNLRELMDVLPNIDVSDVMEIPKGIHFWDFSILIKWHALNIFSIVVFRCDEQTLPCDHTTKYRTLTGWCNNLLFPEYGKSIRAFTRLLAPAYDDGLMSPRSRSVTGSPLPR